MNLDGLEPSILLPAFVAGLLVLTTHVPLGREVLSRGIIFMDLAVAQIAGLGVVLGHGWGWEGTWAVQATAFTAAILGALLLYGFERRMTGVQEALIGSVFVLAATGEMLLLARDPHAGEVIQQLLAGQVLWVGWRQLWPVALISLVLLALWAGLPALRRGPAFYVLFAVAITASVQLVGLYLVFASLILPALAVRRRGRAGLWIGYALGGFAYAAGLTAAALADLPAGPTIVWALAATAVLFGLTARPDAAKSL